MAKGWGDTKPNNNQVRWIDLVEWYKFKGPKDNVEFNHVRLVGPINSAAQHWVKVIKQDGKETKFPMDCAGYNPDTELTNIEKCPACRANISQNKFYFQNAIIRTLQEDKPARAKGIEDYPNEATKEYREIGDKHWSPVRVVRIPSSCAVQLRDIVKLNKHKIDGKIENMDISNVEYGCDLFIKYDKDESPSSMYNVQKGDTTPLTEEEKEYKLFNITDIVKFDIKKSEKDLIRLGYLKGNAQGSSARNSSEDELSIDDDDTLPAAMTDEDELELEEEMELAPEEESKQDKFDKMDRLTLRRFNKKENLGLKIYNTTTDDEIRKAIRKALSLKKGDDKPSCYGNYEATAKCFECSSRSSCPDDSEL